MSDDLERFLAHARGSAAAAKVMRLDALRASDPAEARWSFATMRGRLVELSARGAAATLTAAVEIVIEAQTQSEPVAWITLASGTFYPPDAAESGVDLEALVVVRVADAITAARAAERVLRSGAFGLVVLDLAAGRAEWSMTVQGRLVTLAQTHDAAVVCITDKTADTASIGSLVSLRADALRGRERDGGFHVTVRALKDKQRGPGWSWRALRGGPAGFK
jgi:recombination protein RecA